MQLPAVHPILEARDAAGGAAEAPTPRPAVVAVDLVKTYGSGEAAVTALGGVSASFTAGRFSAIMGRPARASRRSYTASPGWTRSIRARC